MEAADDKKNNKALARYDLKQYKDENLTKI